MADGETTIVASTPVDPTVWDENMECAISVGLGRGDDARVALFASWYEAMASGATEIANKQRAIFEATVADLGEVVKQYKPGGDAQEIIAKQTAFASKALEAAMANTRDIAELVQKSSAEAMKIVQDRMQESYEAIRSGLDKK